MSEKKLGASESNKHSSSLNAIQHAYLMLFYRETTTNYTKNPTKNQTALPICTTQILKKQTVCFSVWMCVHTVSPTKLNSYQELKVINYMQASSECKYYL